MKEHRYIRFGQTLSRVPFLKQLTESEIDDVLLKSVVLECDAGDVLIEEGATGSSFFVLLRGALQVTHQGQEIALLDQPGAILGEQALATGEPRTASVVAAARSFCLKVSPKFVEALSEEHQDGLSRELSGFLVETLAERLVATSNRLAEVERELAEVKGKA